MTCWHGPARIRADAPYRPRTTGTPAEGIPGLSPRGRSAVARLERERYWPGAAAVALRAWSLFVRDPRHRLFDPAVSCGVMICCPDPAELREILHAVAHVLSRKDARALRRRIGELEDLW
ncbi:hypothetical protein HTZ77_04880 [Nonomuraea sp. SMC257]|uniref:Uncharacterized protein n=1 Tax=Nonomuraea montanisoli TaxID=2741721 RepID=A0A7Y6I431_9ACTN|nr:hypothetical protein [Nonomuraea montanisoli]NUW30758.1 hypothetical protein [Nonomuraea montanisoli]